MQKGFIFDINKCTGCEACQIACAIENEVDPQINWRRVHTFNRLRHPGLPHFHHSLACNHCVDPPCMKHCPTVAYSKSSDTGAVTIDADLCIGCGYCSWVCPFDAPQFNHATGIMEKCTLCQHRLDAEQEPACAALCPTGALQFGDYEEDGNEPVPGFTQTDIGPAIRFVPLRHGQTQPVCSAFTDAEPLADIAREIVAEPTPKIHLKSEWPLVAFTLLLATLAGWTAAFSLAGVDMNGVAFFVVAAAAMVLGALHLGNKPRAYRAVMGWRNSWLSREIILVLSFLFLSFICVAIAPAGHPIGWLASLAGLAALFAVDRVYDAVGTGGFRPHSALVVATGFYFFAIFSGNPVVFALLMVIKSMLYWRRKSRLARQKKNPRPMLSLARIILGFFVPVALWRGAAGPPSTTMIVAVFIGELIDRCEYYLELDFPTPSKQMAIDFTAELRRRYDVQS